VNDNLLSQQSLWLHVCDKFIFLDLQYDKASQILVHGKRAFELLPCHHHL